MESSRSQNWATVLLLAKLAIFTVIVPGTVTVWLPLFVLYGDIRRGPIASPGAVAVGLLLMTVGVAGYLWCALDFAFVGKGTPAPIDMPKVLVVRGPYQFSRNPMYISVLCVLAGESIFFWSMRLLEYAAIVALGFHFFVLIQEEPTLKRKMGAAYEQYTQDVPRWIPRFRRRQRTHAV